jgi:hypothetical protein
MRWRGARRLGRVFISFDSPAVASMRSSRWTDPRRQRLGLGLQKLSERVVRWRTIG